MPEAELSDRSRDRKANTKARQKALKLLKAGKAPDEVVERLIANGLSEKQATKLVEKVDDDLQSELGAGRPAARGRTCHQCGDRLAKKAEYCDGCGAKVLDATDREWHRTQIEPQLEKGRKWIGAVAILYALGGIAFGLITENWMVLAINLVLAALQTGLWVWAKTNLLGAAVTALAIFLTVHMGSAILDPATIVNGIVIKVIFVVILVQTIRTALQARSIGTAPT